MHELPGVPGDTDVGTHQIMIEKIRELSSGEKLRRACDLSDAVRVLIIAGIRSRHPYHSPQQILEDLARITLESTLAEFTIDALRQQQESNSCLAG